MINVKDRVPAIGKANRKKITFEDDGSVRYAKVEYADNPVEEGTPINKATLENLVWQGLDKYHIPTSTFTKIVASATSENASYPAYKAFDGIGVPPSYWVSGAYPDITPQRLQIELDAAIIAKEVTFIFRSSTDPSCPKNWLLQGSNNGTDWTTLKTNTIAIGDTQAADISTNATAYKYYSIYITTMVGGNTNYAYVYEMQITKWFVDGNLTTGAYIPPMISSSYIKTYFSIDLPLSEYTINKRLSIKCDTPTVDSVKIPYSPEVYLNINTLGYKKINGSLKDAELYELVYNGTSWDITNGIRYITGSMSVTTTIQTVILGFKPKLVIAYNSLNNDDDVTVGATGHTYKSFPRILTQAYDDVTNGQITETGFTYKGSTTGTVYYIAIR